jgi:hypothetical protein
MCISFKAVRKIEGCMIIVKTHKQLENASEGAKRLT